MKILHIIPHLDTGGADMAVRHLALAQMASGHRVRVCIISGKTTPEMLAGLTDPVMFAFPGSLRDWQGIARIRRLLGQLAADYRPDIIHSHLWPACYQSALAGRAARHVWQVQDTRPWLVECTPRAWLVRMLVAAAKRYTRPSLIAVSAEARDYTCRHLGWVPSTFIIVPNGVDTERFTDSARTAPPGDGTGPLKVVCTSLFRPEKGHAGLLEAIAALRRRGVSLDLHLAGDGETLASCQRQAAALDLAGSVHFLGRISDVASLLAQMDLFVLPSTGCEGMPLSVIEAMACGLPVIASQVAGIPAPVHNGTAGQSIPVGNAAALGRALEWACMNRDQLPLQGRAATRFSRALSWGRIAQQVEAVYLGEQP